MRTELTVAIDVGAQTVRNGIDGLVRVADLRRLVATFNGNRHVRVALLDSHGDTAARSALSAPAHAVPAWFTWLIGGEMLSVDVAVPPATDAGGRIVLTADPTNEVGEVWAESRDAVLVLAGFAGLSALLISLVVGRALRSLETLSAAFEHIGKGDHPGVLPLPGTPELARLAIGFNAMTERLATVAAQNHRLNERLLTLQSEERADLARDLHDEIGPLLFAVDMTAAAIEHLSGSGREHRGPRTRPGDPRRRRPDAAAYPCDPGSPAAARGDRAHGGNRPASGLLARPPRRHRRHGRGVGRGGAVSAAI